MGLSRGELFARLGLIEEVDPLVTEAYDFWEQIELLEKDRGHSHGDPWHISFHGSAFPGDNPVACGRHQLYRMMDIPRGTFSRKSRQLMDMGKDSEVQIVKRLWRAGFLVSSPPLPGVHQTQFEDPDHMLTSTVDAIVLHPRSVNPFVVELKQIYADHVAEMRNLVRDVHDQYVRQVKCQIGMAYEAGPQVRLRCFNTGRLAICFDRAQDGPWICPQHGHGDCLREIEIEPPTHGYLYYVSRDNPLDKLEYYFEYDPEFMATGRRKLAQWRDAFLADELPATQFSDKRFSHPFGWTWTRSQKMPNSPCHWCDFGDICREDHKLAVQRQGKIRLSESAGIDLARGIRPEYDFQAVRSAVLARWGLTEKKAA
jgi:hypothetical protein